MKKAVIVLTVAVTMLALATSGAAAAVVTWHDSWVVNDATSSLYEISEDYSTTGGAWLRGSGAAALGTHTLTDGAVSATFTNTSSGFSISGNGSATTVDAYRLLTISGLGVGETVAAAFNFSLPGVPVGGQYEKWNPDLDGGAWNPPPYFTNKSTTVQLSNGTYVVSLTVGMWSDQFSFGNGETVAEFSVVPEPATMLLLGLGGLLLRKRS